MELNMEEIENQVRIYSVLISQEQLAAQLGISVDTFPNYKLLSEVIPELDELVETGIVTKTVALVIKVFRSYNRNHKQSNKKLRSIELSDSEIQYDSSFLFIYTVFYLYKKNVRYDSHSDIYVKFTEE